MRDAGVRVQTGPDHEQRSPGVAAQEPSAAAPPQAIGKAPVTDRVPGTIPATRLEAFSDAVFAIAITLLVLELRAPSATESLVPALEHEWSRYLGYLVSFAFIGGVWAAHSHLTRFIRAVDATLMRLNLLLLLLVSLLPFSTPIVANHLFASFFEVGHSLSRTFAAERLAVVMFGTNLTLAALTIYLVLRHAAQTAGIADQALASEDLRAFADERRGALVLQGSATLVGAAFPVVAVIFYLSASIFSIVGPVHLARGGPRRARAG